VRRVSAEPLQATPTTGLSALLVLFALLKVLTNSHVAIWAWIWLPPLGV